MSQEMRLTSNSFQKSSAKSISIGQYVNVNQLHKGQTEILNFSDESKGRQLKSFDLDSPIVKTSDYGGIFSTGCSIGGGGFAGIPLRLYITKKIVLEITGGVRPLIIISMSSSSIELESVSFFYTGGLDIYFKKKYLPTKDILQMEGIFLNAGEANGERYDEALFSGGIAYEHIYKDNHSFTLKLGAGLLTTYDKEYTPSTFYQSGKGVRRNDENFLFFWKISWNFFWI